jgi:hypothetical protein
MIAIFRKAKSYECISNVVDVKNMCCSVCNEEHPDDAIEAFMKLLLPVTDRPIKKLTAGGMRLREWKITQ